MVVSLDYANVLVVDLEHGDDFGDEEFVVFIERHADLQQPSGAIC